MPRYEFQNRWVLVHLVNISTLLLKNTNDLLVRHNDFQGRYKMVSSTKTDFLASLFLDLFWTI